MYRKSIGFIVLLLCVYLPVSAAVGISPAIVKKVDSLFIIASSGELKFRDLVAPAIDSIAAIGAAAVPRLVEKYDTQDARERLTINNILVKIGRPAVPYLLESLLLENPEQVSRICFTLGEIKESSAVAGLIKVAGRPDWWIRSESAAAIGKIGDSSGNQTVMNLLLDTVETVRKSAAVSAGQLKIEGAIPTLVHMLGDAFYGARFCASEALIKFGDAAVGAISDSMNNPDTLLGNLGCATLGMIGSDSAMGVLVGQLQSEFPIRRTVAVKAILLSNSPLACGYIELMKSSETDPFVLFYINQVINKYAPR